MKPSLALFAILAVTAAGCSAGDEDTTSSDEADYSVAGGTRCLLGSGTITGPTEAKYLSLGGCVSFLGPPVHSTLSTPDGRGTYAAFYNGSIYHRPDLGAHVVRGEIRELWKAFGWETGPLGYPISDETLTPDGRGGRYTVFEGGSIYWSRRTGAHEVRGAIRDRWAELGWESGALGYPVSGEIEVPGGIRSNFERGSLTWTRETGEITVKFGL